MTRVAAYCRVSTDQRDQLHSFENQKQFFKTYIDSRPEWRLYEIYADEGITGTTTADRFGFLKMIGDARAGRFDLILTKEISRFSRNILDAVAYTRLLKKLGVAVIFLSDGISTADPDAELRLGIMASVAQEESRKTSERVKWGQRRKMERGVVFGRSLLGYDVRGGVMTVEEKGAEVVRMIFDLYVFERLGVRAIAAELTRRGIPTAGGSASWSPATVLKILKNEKYCGDLRQRKTVTTDYLTHKKTRNIDESDTICQRDHHEPIIGRELWEKAQAELTRKAANTRIEPAPDMRQLPGPDRIPGTETPEALMMSLPIKPQTNARGCRYALSGRIVCGVCGGVYACRTRKRRDGTVYRVWRRRCGCPEKQRQLREEAIGQSVRRFIARIGAEHLLEGFKEILERIAAYPDGEEAAVRTEIMLLEKKQMRLSDAYIAEDIDREAYLKLRESYDGDMSRLLKKLRSLEESHAAETPQSLLAAATALAEGSARDLSFYLRLVDSIRVFPGGAAEFNLCGKREALRADFK